MGADAAHRAPHARAGPGGRRGRKAACSAGRRTPCSELLRHPDFTDATRKALAIELLEREQHLV